MVQVPGAEDDPALPAAVGVDGVELLASLLVKGSLKEDEDRISSGCSSAGRTTAENPHLAGEPSLLSAEPVRFLCSPVEVAAVVTVTFQPFCQELAGSGIFFSDSGFVYAFGGQIHLQPGRRLQSEVLVIPGFDPDTHLLQVAPYPAGTVVLHVGRLGFESRINS